MTDAQKQQHADTYRRLKLAGLRAGESVGKTRVWLDVDPTKRMERWLAK